uniref:GRANULINS domain-containing protein n=1 Tax=Steinernema glaseri TaxID=37863 RepID=A0A1I7YK82_9BILA
MNTFFILALSLLFGSTTPNESDICQVGMVRCNGCAGGKCCPLGCAHCCLSGLRCCPCGMVCDTTETVCMTPGKDGNLTMTDIRTL